ncbi:phage tail protein [Telmatospirillum sp.]|uniref:TipJ family phage tail tip protein n=1 Tax=Telmatospirillum sp. TaxID=2079197 RepID=UPI00283CC10D|nr:DUF1983 domain-containing protein [Telmatospirillum sp.]MDR3436443.1 DUF1983 domain-containing protein [Telmatospirillum sp.]
MNPDGSTNFYDSNVNFFDGQGDPTYTITPALGGSSSSSAVSTQLFPQMPVVRTTQACDINFINIRLDVDELYLTDTSGDTYTTSFQYTVETKLTSATTWTLAVDQTISGKTMSTYVRQIRIPVTALTAGTDTYDIRVTLISGESTSTYVANIVWESWEEIRTDTFKWPHTACVQMWGRATNQFSSMPTFGAELGGLIIKVPSNYNPTKKTYSGIWDGTFKLAWTDNPAWILYDFVTNTRYGMSAYSSIYLDKYSIYDAGVWCDDTMSNGAARYTFNELIATQRSGRDQCTYLAGIFNAAFFDDGNGTAFVMIDQPTPATLLFAEENTIDGFQYSFTDMATRYNFITVTFTNPDLNWNNDQRLVKDPDDIAINGMVPLNFIAQGCTSAYEAINRARYKMVTSLTECMSVSFKTNRQGCFVKPWDVMLVADPTTGYAVSGRIRSVDIAGKILSLRDPITLEAGQSYGISIVVPNGIFTAKILNPAVGENMSLTLDAAVPSNLPTTTVFALTGGNLGLPKPFRVLKIEKVDGNADQVQITAIEINRNKWTAINDGIVIDTPTYNTQTLNSVDAVTNLTASQTVTSSTLGTQIDLDLAWTKSTSTWVTDYQITYSRNGGASTVVTTGGENQAVITNVLVGTYTISVCAVGFGVTSSPLTITYDLTTDSILLAAVTGLELYGQANDTEFTGTDAKFVWNFNSAYGSTEPLGSETGDGAGYVDSWFQDFYVSIYNLDGTLRRTETTQDPTYTYTLEKNYVDGDGTPARAFLIEVAWHDNFGRVSPTATLSVSNPAAKLPTSVAVAAAFQNVFVTWVNDAELDFKGTMVWISTTSGFTPSSDNLAYDGVNSVLTYPATTGTTYYVVLSSYDTFGEYDLTYSAEMSVTTAQLKGVDIAKGIISSDMLTDALASTINLITAGPTTPGSVAAQIAELTNITDGQYTAINSTINGLTTTVNGNTAAITNEESTRAKADTANAEAIQALTANVSNNYASNVALSQAIATATTSWSQQLNVLSASVSSNYATNTELSQAIAGINSSSSTFLQQLNSTVASSSTSIQQMLTTVNGVSAQWGIKVNNNGVICGIGLMSSVTGTGGVTSEVQIFANQFEIVNPTTNGKVVPFIVQNGSIYMDAGAVEIANLVVENAQIANAAIDTAKIAELTVTGGKIASNAVSNRVVATGTAPTAYLVTQGNPVLIIVSSLTIQSTSAASSDDSTDTPAYIQAIIDGSVIASTTAPYTPSAGGSVSAVGALAAGTHSFSATANGCVNSIYVQELTK